MKILARDSHRTGTLGGLSRRRLRWLLSGFFIALAVPAGALVAHAYSQLKWEAFHLSRSLAEELAGRVDQQIRTLLSGEDGRGFATFQFLVVRGDAKANVIEPSELAALPTNGNFPGLIGHFQIDPQGQFSSPLLPSDDGLIERYIAPQEIAYRKATVSRILSVLTSNALVSNRTSRDLTPSGKIRLQEQMEAGQRASPAALGAKDLEDEATSPTQTSSAPRRDVGIAASGESLVRKFDELKKSEQEPLAKRKRASIDAPNIGELDLSQPYVDAASEERQALSAPQQKQRNVRKEISQLPVTPPTERARTLGEAGAASARVRTFESELEPFELDLLDSAHMVLHRTVWRDGQRWIQGALVAHDDFMTALVRESFMRSPVSSFSNLVVAWRDQVSTVFPGRQNQSRYSRSREESMQGALLYRARMSAPAADLELLFTLTRIPAGPGAKVVAWVTSALALVLAGGVLIMYRLGCREIDLTAQQQEFVAAVSHELRTPLTSIRMYAEMLREGWASEEKKRSYYDFIVQESERLSRLITNVLQLARMTRNEFDLTLRRRTVSELLEAIRSKVATQVTQAGFELDIEVDSETENARINVDDDSFSQIFINLLDNAIKFSANAEQRRIKLSAIKQASDSVIVFSVRDFGPGIARDQMKKIFRLFYRSENELTRETVGTGIGLALVHELANAMGASVEVRNSAPGAQFQLKFPLA